MVYYIKHLKDTLGYEKKFLRSDNADESSIMEELSDPSGLGITFGYTATDSPGQNRHVEQNFLMSYGIFCSMLNTACLSKTLHNWLWYECNRTHALLVHLNIYNIKNNPHHTIFHKNDTPVFNHLKKFIEVTIVTVGPKIKRKL